MHKTTSLKEKLTLFSTLLFPILITQLSMSSMTFLNTIRAVRAGAAVLAGVAIWASLCVPMFSGINGILIAITPIIAQLTGAKATKDIPGRVQQAIYVSIGLAIIILLIGFFALDPILNMMDLEQNVRHIAKYYLVALSTGIIPLFIFNTLRSFIDSLGKTRVSMTIILISLPINVLFNYVFIFGKFGVPAFGGIGSGIATSLTYLLTSIIIVGIIHKVRPFSDLKILSSWQRPSLKAWIEQLKIGVPIGVSLFFETSIFSAMTIFMSVYSTYTIAAHQAAMNFSSLLYMIPLSVGMTLTIAVGFEVGAKRFVDARTYSYIGLSGGIFIAIIAGLILFVFDLTKNFLCFAIFFQFADAFAAPIQGALRAYKDVNVTLITSFISYWLIGLPTGWLLANYTELGPYGYWVGIIAGLSAGAIALIFRLLYIQKKYPAKEQSHS